MTLPATGSLSMSQIASELGISAAGISLNHSWVRALAGVLSGAISFANLRGKTGRFDGALATIGPGLSVQFGNAPFFGVSLFELDVTLGSSPQVNLFLNTGTMTWSGAITVVNNTTGVSARLTYSSTSGYIVYQVSGSYPNLIRSGATADSFTVIPSN